MRRTSALPSLHYFDICAGVVALVIMPRLIVVTVATGLTWHGGPGLVAAAFLASLIALTALRNRAYSQSAPWLTGAFAATATAAVFTFFWSLDLVWFAAALVVNGCALAFAMVLRTKHIAEPMAVHDVIKLTALAIGLLLGLGCVEIALRLAPGVLGPEMRQLVRAEPSAYGIAHPYIGYLHRPNATTIVEGRDFRAVHQVDGHGFRNAWPWPQRAAIVVVGDSLAFGYGAAASKAWPQIVADALPGSSLINLALIGAGPQQYLRLYETFGVPLHPKLLLVGVFVRNDYWDAEMFDRWLREGAEANYLVWRDFGAPGPHRWVRSSRVYNLVRALHDLPMTDSAASETFRFDDGHQIVLSVADFLAKSEMGTADSRPFHLAMDAFARIHSMATANGTKVLMVLQPSKEETYLPLLRRDVPDPTAALRQGFRERGIDYLDLTAGFRERAKAGERLFYEMDGHPNPAGYALTASLVLADLKQHANEYGLVAFAKAAASSASGEVTTVVDDHSR